MRTTLCEMLGLEIPIIQAGMGGAACPELAAAVSNAGGLGMLAVTWITADAARQEIRKTRALTDRPFGVNLVLHWNIEENLALSLDEGVRVISFFWGDPRPYVERVHSRGAKILLTVGSVEEAQIAVESGVDIIVAQGWEAGGHVRGTVGTLPLVPEVVDAVSPTPVVAAGGIADGRGLAAVLALGASGAWIGTRFLGSEEAAIHPRYRELLIRSHAGDTLYSENLFDVNWPHAPHRALKNTTVKTWEEMGRPEPGTRPGEGEVIATSRARGPIVRYRAFTPSADTEGNIEALSLWAGQGVGLLSRTQPAAEIVREIADGARARLQQLCGSLRLDLA